MASVRKSGAGWLMIWNAGSGDGRKQAYRKFEGASKRAAIAEARRLEAEAKGLDAAGAKDTLGAYLDRWVAAHRAKVSTRTMDRYITLLAHVRPRLGSRPLRDVSGRDLQTLYAELAAGADSRPLAAQTIRHVHAVVRRAFRDAVRWNLILRAPTEAADPPRVARRNPVVSSRDDLTALLAAIEEPDVAAIVELAALTGARRQEILALEWSAIDLEGGRLTICQAIEESSDGIRIKETKSAAGARTIHLPARAIAVLSRHRARHAELRLKLGGDWPFGDLLFPSYANGGPRRPRNVTKAVARARAKAGIEGGTLHGFRHGHVSALLAAGVNPKVVQQRAGHSTIATTMNVYAHCLPGADRDAADKIAAVYSIDEAEPVRVPNGVPAKRPLR